jgi:hypothetical protein
MIITATIVRPARLEGLFNNRGFIPPNSKDHLIEVDMNFTTNPIYRQEKLCYFLPANIYYQKLVIFDGKMNPIKDDARTLVITGKVEAADPIHFNVTIYPSLPANATIDTGAISLPFYPELNTELVIRDRDIPDNFYQFSCTKIIYSAGSLPQLQLRCMDHYKHRTLAAVLHKWHPGGITVLNNIPKE